MSGTDGNQEEQKKDGSGSSSSVSTDPPEPVLSAVTAKREDQIQNAVAFLSHSKVAVMISQSLLVGLCMLFTSPAACELQNVVCVGTKLNNRVQKDFSAEEGSYRS